MQIKSCLYTGPFNVLHYTSFICCGLLLQTESSQGLETGMGEITGEDSICFLSHPRRVLFAPEGQAMGIFQDILQIGTDTHLVSPFFHLLKSLHEFQAGL